MSHQPLDVEHWLVKIEDAFALGVTMLVMAALLAGTLVGLISVQPLNITICLTLAILALIAGIMCAFQIGAGMLAWTELTQAVHIKLEAQTIETHYSRDDTHI